jgi:hypothetical protein
MEEIIERKKLLEKYRIKEPDETQIYLILRDFVSDPLLDTEFKRKFPSLTSILKQRNKG